MGRPALTPESRENQLVSLAINLAEKQLREGTASSQVITHYLKLGSTQAKLEQEKLKQENELLKAKTETIKSAKEIETEKDRNYIISVFSGIVSFAALIVALVALFKGVG